MMLSQDTTLGEKEPQNVREHSPIAIRLAASSPGCERPPLPDASVRGWMEWLTVEGRRDW